MKTAKTESKEQAHMQNPSRPLHTARTANNNSGCDELRTSLERTNIPRVDTVITWCYLCAGLWNILTVYQSLRIRLAIWLYFVHAHLVIPGAADEAWYCLKHILCSVWCGSLSVCACVLVKAHEYIVKWASQIVSTKNSPEPPFSLWPDWVHDYR